MESEAWFKFPYSLSLKPSFFSHRMRGLDQCHPQLLF